MKVLKSRVLLGSPQDEVGFVLLEYIWLVRRESLCGIVPADHPTGQQAFGIHHSITRGVFCNIPGKHAYIPGKHPNLMESHGNHPI